jgi:hypothetical protein
MDDKIKKILAIGGIAAMLGGVAKISYEVGQYSNRPKAVVQRDITGDEKSDIIIPTHAEQKFIYINRGDDTYMRLNNYMDLKKNEIIKQTQDIK